MSTEPQSHPVFGVAELLEMILLHLPQSDILVFQRVSKIWKDAVAQCPAVRRKLFFEAALPNETIFWEGPSPWREYSIYNFQHGANDWLKQQSGGLDAVRRTGSSKTGHRGNKDFMVLQSAITVP